MGFLREAEVQADRSDTATIAWLHHAQAASHVVRGRLRDAETRVKQAIAGYRRAKDTYGEARARLLRVEIAEARRDVADGLRLARDARAFATRHGHRALAGMALVRSGRLYVHAGKNAPAVRVLRTALAELARIGDPHGRFLAHYWLSVAYAELEDHDRARFEAQAATHFAGFVDKRSCPEARDMRAIRVLGRYSDA
jgi:tetratricopeptide (TPR) repeat protein